MTKEEWIEKTLPFLESKKRRCRNALFTFKGYNDEDLDKVTALTIKCNQLTELLRVAEEEFNIKGEG